MGTPRFQASFVVSQAHTMYAWQPSGAPKPPIVVTIAAGTIYANVDALCADIQSQLEASEPGDWTVSVPADGTGKVRITAAGGSIDWTWTTGTVVEVRNLLGYGADAANETSPWVAANAHDYGLYPVESLQQGTQDEGYRAQPQTIGSVTLAGYSDANHTQGSRIRTRDLVINLQRTSGGAWTELDKYWAFLADIADGRQFTVYPDEADLATHYHLHFVGPDEIPLKQRWERIWRYFQARWTCQEVD